MKNKNLSKAETLAEKSIICDLALGFEPELEVASKWDLIPRYLNAGFNFLGLAISGDSTSLETTMRYLARHRNRLEQDDKIIMVNTVADIQLAKKLNKLAVCFWFQGTNALNNDINMVDIYYDLGVRYLLLTYNKRNAVGDGCAETHDGGLSDFGRLLIERMNKVGMLIDLSHASLKTSLDVMACSEDPVIFSHSNVFSVHPHPRNLKDQQIKVCAAKGGIIGINGANMLLGEKGATIEAMIEHIDAISQLVGSEYVSLGLDLVYFHSVLELFFEKTNPGVYSKEYLSNMDPQSWQSVQPESILQLIEGLQKRGYKNDAIQGILGENFLRVTKEVWRS